MKIILFGASGMIGQGVLRECLLDDSVTEVVAVGRTPTGKTHAKLKELAHKDFLDFTTIADQLTGFDACFWCLGITSAGMTEADYRRITVDYAMAAARVLAERNPQMTFVFVSGIGTDPTGKSRTMWARVKGEAENAVAALPFKATYMFRPGYIQPMHGIVSKTAAYRAFYAVLGWMYPVLSRLFPTQATTTERLGKAMIRVGREGYAKHVVVTADMNVLGR